MLFQFVGRQQKMIIINLFKTRKEEQLDMKYKELMAFLSGDTGIGMCTTVTSAINEYKKLVNRRHQVEKNYRPIIFKKIDDFDKNVILQKIHGFWLRREILTLNKIIQAIDDDPDLPNVLCTSLRRVLKELNFEYTKRNWNSALTERGDLVVWQQKYIQYIRHYCSEGRTIYFLNETWINTGECSSKV